MSEQTIRLTINSSGEVGDEELNLLTEQLRDELLETDVNKIDFAHSGATPEGSRGPDPVTLGSLVVALAASGGVLTTLINAAQAWLMRNDKKTITLEGKDGSKITITGHPSPEEKKLIEEWKTTNLGA